MRTYEHRFRKTINFLASFPGFFIPIGIFAYFIRDIRIITLFVLTLITVATIQLLIKYLVPTQRPSGYHPDEIMLNTSIYSSFPSNHTSWSFILFLFVYGFLPHLTIWFWLFAISVALGRIYLKKHHPRDILWSIIISLIIYELAKTIFLYLSL